MWSSLKNILINYNYIDRRAVTSPENFLSNKALLALDWSHQELVAMMHDLCHILVLVDITFWGLKNVL